MRRTLPRILLTQSPLVYSIPTETALYELIVANDAETKEAGDYELFTDLASNEDGLRLSVNGMPFTDVMAYTAFPYGAAHVRAVARARGIGWCLGYGESNENFS